MNRMVTAVAAGLAVAVIALATSLPVWGFAAWLWWPADASLAFEVCAACVAYGMPVVAGVVCGIWVWKAIGDEPRGP